MQQSTHLSFYPHLFGQTDNLIKHSQSQRHELENNISILSDRVSIDDTYMKSLIKFNTNLAKNKGSDSLFISTLRSHVQNKIDQLETFVSLIKSEIILMAKELHQSQTQHMKRLTDEAKMLEKEYRIKSDRLADIEFTYKSKCREAEYSATLDMIYMADPEISEEKKFRQSFKTQQIIDESHEMEKIHSLSIQQYNEYLEIYKTKIENIYNLFEEQENQRQILLKDAMLKLIIFEASYLKNIQYDVERLSEQLQKVNIAHQLQNFIRLHLQDIKVPKTVQFVRYETMISKSLNSIRDKSYYRRQVNLADFIIPNEDTDINTLTLKGHEVQQTFSYIYLVLNKMWNTQHNLEDEESVVQILSNDEQARQLWVLVFTHFKQKEKLDIPDVDTFIRHIKQILNIAYEKHDVHLGRQILWISSWFRSQHKYLYEFLGDHQLFQSRDFFEAALIENIHDTLQEDKKQSAGLQYNKRIERQKMAIYRAISSICSSMQLLKMCQSEIKILGQKYARLSQLPSELLEQLNVQMEATR